MRLVPTHWNARYAVSRASEIVWRRLHPDAPWLTPAAVAFLDGWIKPGDQGLEWGSGRSTLWLAARGCSLVTIEHDATWARRVRDTLSRRGFQGQVVCRYDKDPESYTRAAQECPDLSLDF